MPAMTLGKRFSPYCFLFLLTGKEKFCFLFESQARHDPIRGTPTSYLLVFPSWRTLPSEALGQRFPLQPSKTELCSILTASLHGCPLMKCLCIAGAHLVSCPGRAPLYADSLKQSRALVLLTPSSTPVSCSFIIILWGRD